MNYQTPEVEEGINHKKYDIDVSDLNLGNKGGSTKQQMNTNHILKNIKDTNIWVRYDQAPSPNGDGITIRGIGTLDIVAADLGISGKNIVREAENEIDDDEVLKKITEKADKLAEALQQEWGTTVEGTDVLGGSIEANNVGVDGNKIFVGFVDEAFTYEVKYVVEEFGFEDDDDVYDVLRTILYEAVKLKVRDRHRRPHAEYMGKLDLSGGEKWQIRAIELEQNSPLPRQTAKVVALKQELKTNIDIAHKLDIDDLTVGRHLDRAERIMEESEWMVENVEL